MQALRVDVNAGRKHNSTSVPHASDGNHYPVLVSAIGNTVFGLFWLFTFFGVVVAVPMFVLCIFKFMFDARAGRWRPAQIASEARALGVLEVLIGIFNLISFICGIIVLVNASNFDKKHRRSEM